MYTILLVIHTILVLALIIMVLVQRTDSDGLSGLSGGGGNQFLTGRGSANFFTRTTAVLAGLFMVTSLILVVMGGNINNRSIVDEVMTEQSQSVTEAPAQPAPKETPKKAPAVPKPE